MWGENIDVSLERAKAISTAAQRPVILVFNHIPIYINDTACLKLAEEYYNSCIRSKYAIK